MSESTKYCLKVVSDNKAAGDNHQRVIKYAQFITKFGQSPDANVVLKVNRDRICNKWLYCRSAVQVVNSKKQTENLCFDVGACSELNEEGDCVKPLDLNKSGISLTEQKFFSPDNISQLKNLSGLAKVGVEWPGGKKIFGYYDYAAMSPIGADINIPNSGFESGEVWPWEIKDKTIAAINVVNDLEDKTNKVLKITPNSNAPDGSYLNVQVPIGYLDTDYDYAISFGIKSSSQEKKNISVSLKLGSQGNYRRIQNFSISNYWQTVVLTAHQQGSQFVSNTGSTNDGYLVISSKKEAGNDFDSEFYIDNVSMKSILPVASGINRQRTCRLYPSATAPACNYTDLAGKQYRGWQGFCVEPDPKYFSLDSSKQMCLNWWPVDILPGETDIFGTDQQAGYSGRQPLYYCLEAEGNYPYYDHQVHGYCGGNCGWYDSDGNTQSFDVSNLNIYKDEILQVKINGVQIDDDSDEKWDDCGLANDDPDINPSVPIDSSNPNEKGTIILNEKNKEGWTAGFTNKRDDCPNGSYNKYAYLRTRSNGHKCGGDNKCNVMSARLKFDADNKLVDVIVKYEDGSGGTGKAKFDSITITFKGPRCDVLAQVVTPDGRNAAWSARVQKNGWAQENNLGYQYGQDYAPYGAAVVPAPVSDPSLWKKPLYVMPADTSSGMTEPYQVRAGSPYSVFRSIADSPNIGIAQCVAGSADKLGAQCKSNADCGYSLEGKGHGLCMGINLSEQAKSHLTGGYFMGKKNLSKLFAKSYRIWKWADTDKDGVMSYEEITGDPRFSWDITKNGGADKPEVVNIKVNDQNGKDAQGNPVKVEFKGPKKITLKFNAIVNENHLPMVAYRVDWGDGSTISQVGNLKIYPRTNPNKPHILFHTYKCANPGNDGKCHFIPKIQVQDNWGWCNNSAFDENTGSKCNGWTEFGGEVIVTE